jgi:hypothetical protein
MSNFQSNVHALLRKAHQEEAAAGFPRLKRIPQTQIIWLLDFYSTLDAAEQDALLDALARFGARMFSPQDASGKEYQELLDLPAYAKFEDARKGPAAHCGTRYIPVKSMDLYMRDPNNFLEIRSELTPLNFQPRPDLVADPDCLRAAKAPQLRKLMDESVRRLFAPDKKKVEKEKRAGGACVYPGVVGNSRTQVHVDFGSRMGQVCYQVGVVNSAGKLQFPCIYEYLWGAAGGWDYLTEENAPRSIDFLAEQVVYLVRLIEQVSDLAGRPAS